MGKIKGWKKVSENKQGITYENEELKTVLDIATPYRFGKNSFVGVSIAGQGTRTFPIHD